MKPLRPSTKTKREVRAAEHADKNNKGRDVSDVVAIKAFFHLKIEKNIEQDNDKASKAYQKACDSGNKYACGLLSR